MRKEKSECYPDVMFQNWKTPLDGKQSVKLASLLQTKTDVHFFFCLDDEKKIHVMTIPSTLPYRLIEEEYAYNCIGKYFAYKNPSQPVRGRPRKISNSWKLWGTQFIRELDEGRALSDYKETPNPKLFEYLISTNSEWIEFVSLYVKPKWEVFENIKMKKLLKQFVHERYRD